MLIGFFRRQLLKSFERSNALQLELQMPADIKRKKTLGSVSVDHVSPELSPDAPKAMNIHLGFEEALKLHLGLGQVLAQLNSYNRSKRASRRSGANLCLYTQKLRITVNESWVREKSADNATTRTGWRTAD